MIELNGRRFKFVVDNGIKVVVIGKSGENRID